MKVSNSKSVEHDNMNSINKHDPIKKSTSSPSTSNSLTNSVNFQQSQQHNDDSLSKRFKKQISVLNDNEKINY